MWGEGAARRGLREAQGTKRRGAEGKGCGMGIGRHPVTCRDISLSEYIITKVGGAYKRR